MGISAWIDIAWRRLVAYRAKGLLEEVRRLRPAMTSFTISSVVGPRCPECEASSFKSHALVILCKNVMYQEALLDVDRMLANLDWAGLLKHDKWDPMADSFTVFAWLCPNREVVRLVRSLAPFDMYVSQRLEAWSLDTSSSASLRAFLKSKQVCDVTDGPSTLSELV